MCMLYILYMYVLYKIYIDIYGKFADSMFRQKWAVVRQQVQ